MAYDKAGYVYVLASRACAYVKIGGTDSPPMRRLRELNSTEPYRELGPWSLEDFRQVTDWRQVEHNLHYTFRSKLVQDSSSRRELFEIAVSAASERLAATESALLVKKPVVDRLFQDQDLAAYLVRLYSVSGLMNWIDAQGAWTMVLFPKTSGGRYYTINIGPHEVAFSSLPHGASEAPVHGIVLDRLIYDFPDVRRWIAHHRGGFQDDHYASALPRSALLSFKGTFRDAGEFLGLDGVRRALVAYWGEGLTDLKERGVSSVYARFHNWNAVAELLARMTRA